MDLPISGCFRILNRQDIPVFYKAYPAGKNTNMRVMKQILSKAVFVKQAGGPPFIFEKIVILYLIYQQHPDSYMMCIELTPVSRLPEKTWKHKLYYQVSNVLFCYKNEILEPRYLVFILLFSLSSLLFGGCANVKPPAPFVPVKAYVLKNVEYAVSTDTTGLPQHLTLDIYFPAQTKAAQKFPLFVMMHAGSYQVGNKEWQKSQCAIMADSGFIAVSINYRKGWRSESGCYGSVFTLSQAEYRAMQDARASLRFLVSKAKLYNIDTSWIFTGGESAGAAIALNASYATDNDGVGGDPEMAISLGTLNNSGNNLPHTYTIKGICNKSGAISDSAFITSSTAIPTISFHGSKDQLVPIDKGYFLGCHKTPAFGSLCIHRRLLAANSISVLYIKKGAPHMPTEFSPEFTMSKVAVFFRQIMLGTAKSEMFIE